MKISSLEKLEKARLILNTDLIDHIISYSYNPEQNQMRFDFKNGSRLYIVYNDFDEYAYQLMFSFEPLDRIRFDAMDKNWKVENPPHHFHPRFDEQGFNSPMCGIPSKDLPQLIKLIKSHKLEQKNFRF